MNGWSANENPGGRKAWARLLSAAGLSAGLLLAGNPALGGQGLDKYLGFVDTLLNSSSAARSVQDTDNAEARKLYERAKSQYREAKAAWEDGRKAEARSALSDSETAMFRAARLAGTGGDDGAREAFNQEMDSVQALMEAHDRISKEKGAESEHARLARKVKEQLTSSRDALDQEDMESARARLDKAYVAVKLGIRQLRGGETLVRSLDLTPKETYFYELDRNDTFRMLLDQVIGKGQVAGMKARLEKAVRLREGAQRQASSGNYEKAVETLDKANDQLLEAIRSTGVYIPG